MQMVGVLIGVVIALVVGVSLIPTIGNAVTASQTTFAKTTSVGTLVGLLPIIFIAIIILGAVGFMSQQNKG